VLTNPGVTRCEVHRTVHHAGVLCGRVQVFFSAAALCAVSSESSDDDGEYGKNETSAWCLEIWAAAHLLFMGFPHVLDGVHGRQARGGGGGRESVPMSAGYLILRVREWTLVMLGGRRCSRCSEHPSKAT